jgi:hypothetical protein
MWKAEGNPRRIELQMSRKPGDDTTTLPLHHELVFIIYGEHIDDVPLASEMSYQIGFVSNPTTDTRMVGLGNQEYPHLFTSVVIKPTS